MLLGVNIDHIAVLREARAINDPDPLEALGIVKRAGADQITVHLREDRRHIVDEDVKAIIKHSYLPVNVECAADDEILNIILPLSPRRITLVPEKRQELTTEGGLNLESNFNKIEKAIKNAKKAEVEVSLFVDPNEKSIQLSKELDASWVELHTGTFANIYAMLNSNLKQSHHKIKELDLKRKELERLMHKAIGSLEMSSALAHKMGLFVAAGHGLNYQNVNLITKIPFIKELNIGQSIIARSIFVGLEKAIIQMRESF